MPCPRHAHERGARDPTGQGTPHSKGDPPVLLPPQDHGRSHDSIEPSLQAVEVELSKGGPKSSPVPGQGDRGVILIHVGLCHFARIKVGGLEQTGGEAPPTERDHCRSEHGPPGHPEQQRLTGTEAGRADQDEPTHALRILDRDFSGDRPPHGVPDEHGSGNLQRVHEGNCQLGVSGIVVRGRGFVG